MAKNYSYPRVTMSTLAKKHSHNVVNVPDTTIMFAPLVTEKGPDDRVVKIRTLSEFIEVFGSFNEDFYNLNGQMALNVYNWLNNGGTLMVKRLGGDSTHSQFTYQETGAAEYDVSKKIFTNGDKVFIPTGTQMLCIKKEYEVGEEPNKTKEVGYIIINLESIKTTTDTNGKQVIDFNAIEYDYSNLPTGTDKLVKIPDTEMYNLTGEATDSPIIQLSVREKVKAAIQLRAKYHGKYYNKITLEAEEVTSHGQKTYYNFYVKYNDTALNKSITLEKFLQKDVNTYSAALNSSEYIEEVYVDGIPSLKSLFDETHNFGKNITSVVSEKCTHKFTLTNGQDAVTDYIGTEALVKAYWTTETEAAKDLGNRIETPIDIIFDAGYSSEIKKAILAFVRNDIPEVPTRPDIVFIMDNIELSNKLKLDTPTNGFFYNNSEIWGSTNPTNVAIYEQYFTILDSVFTNQQIFVAPSYFLTKLIAYNDITYGVQYPTAGLRRGLLDDALWVDNNPSPDQKETWFVKRVNYVEKSSREYAFMSQRTFDGSSDMEYTALSFLNNERVLERMKKDLETIGRSYLHEFNDAVTIANMTTALNKYVANWIANRTLSMGVVEVVQDEVSENALDINLNIRFTNTIEVINVSIVIE